MNFKDLLFSVAIKIPERLLPQSIKNWTIRYAQQKMEKMQQELIRRKWQKIDLEQTLSSLKEKAQSED